MTSGGGLVPESRRQAPAGGGSLKEYIRLDGLVLGYVSGGVLYWMHQDHIGRPRLVTAQNGDVQWQTAWTPFGKQRTGATSGTVPTDLRFPGQRWDWETGFAYNYFRDYDYATARYAQSDPIGLGGGWNTYAYVGGNPVIRVDPLGLVQADSSYSGIDFKGGATAVCDGRGGIRIKWYGNYSGCIKDCVAVHEQTHGTDFFRWDFNVCEGQPDGTFILVTRSERAFTEVRAYSAEIGCLKAKLRNMTTCKRSKCEREIRARISQMEIGLKHWQKLDALVY